MVNIDFFQINKSGQSYNLYEQGSNTYKGKINNREAFIILSAEGDVMYIGFLNSSGQFDSVRIDLYAHPAPNGFFTSCLDYPYSTEVINGVSYRIFKMRQTKNVYTADGNYWGAVAAGMYVATNSDKVGQTHCDWKLINYVKSTKGQWVKVSGARCEYGFVDTGLKTSSLYTGIPFYGSW